MNLDDCPLLATVNNTQCYCEHSQTGFVWTQDFICPGIKLLDPRNSVCSHSRNQTVCKALSPLENSTGSVHSFSLSLPLQHLSLSVFFDWSHRYDYKMLSHCGFNLHFTDCLWHREPSYVCIGHLYFFFGEMHIEMIWPFLSRVLFFCF